MKTNSEERKVFAVLGASNHSTNDREENDYYATDPIAMELLLDIEQFSPEVWECACGEGHLSKVLESRGYHVMSTDLIDRGFGESGVDFLNSDIVFDGDIITNPPYKYAKEFVEHAIEHVTAEHRVAMLLKIQFLEGKARRELFEKYPLNTYTFLRIESTAARMETSVPSSGRTTAHRLMRGTYGRKDLQESLL